MEFESDSADGIKTVKVTCCASHARAVAMSALQSRSIHRTASTYARAARSGSGIQTL